MLASSIIQASDQPTRSMMVRSRRWWWWLLLKRREGGGFRGVLYRVCFEWSYLGSGKSANQTNHRVHPPRRVTATSMEVNHLRSTRNSSAYGRLGGAEWFDPISTKTRRRTRIHSDVCHENNLNPYKHAQFEGECAEKRGRDEMAGFPAKANLI